MSFFHSKAMFAFYLLSLAQLFGVYAVSPYFSDYDTYIRFHWKGALTSHSIVIKVMPYLDKLTQASYNTHLVLYNKGSGNILQNIKPYTVTFAQESYPVGLINIDSLNPATQYYYAFVFTQDSTIAVDSFTSFYSANNPQEFGFKTLGMALKPYSFKFGSGSCSHTATNNTVFQNLANENLDFFLQIGDLHYENIGQNDPNLFYEAYYKVFQSAVQRTFYQKTPFSYNWDDHDFGPNDSDGTSPSKDAVTTAFHKFVPYYTLKNRLPSDDSSAFADAPKANTDSTAYLDYTSDPFYGIFRSFIVGRCLFIQMDLRTHRNVIPGDVLGDEQKSWLENQFRFAANNQGIQMVFLISSSPWIHTQTTTDWTGYESTQQLIANHVKNYIYAKQKKIMMICGDAHMIAFDDGRNNVYGGFPVVHTAPLDQVVSYKGGPYSHGSFQNRGQYGAFQVTDQSNSLCVKFDLKYQANTLISYDICYPIDSPASKDDSNNVGIICAIVFSSVFVAMGVIIGGYCTYKKFIKKKASKKQAPPDPNKKPSHEMNLIDQPIQSNPPIKTGEIAV